MKKFNIVAVAVMTLAPFFINAQINQTPITGGGRQIVLPSQQAKGTAGSLYVNEKFMPAKLSNNDQTILVRYDAFHDYFEMNNSQDGKILMLPKTQGVTVTIINTHEVYSLENYASKKEGTATGYLKVVADQPKIKIFKKERIFLQPGSTSDNSYQASKPATYKKADDEIYVKINSGEAVFVSDKKDVAKLVPAKSKEVLDFIKKNKLDLEKETDLQQLSGYLETIL